VQTTLKIVSFPDEYSGLGLTMVLANRTGHKFPHHIKFEKSATARVIDNTAKWKFSVLSVPMLNPADVQDFSDNLQFLILTEMSTEVVRVEAITVAARGGLNVKKMGLHTRITIDFDSAGILPHTTTPHPPYIPKLTMHAGVVELYPSFNNNSPTVGVELSSSPARDSPDLQHICDVVNQLAVMQTQVQQMQQTLQEQLEALQPNHSSHSSFLNTLQTALSAGPGSPTSFQPHLCVYGGNARVVRLSTFEELHARTRVEFQIPNDRVMQFSYKIQGTYKKIFIILLFLLIYFFRLYYLHH
jgi:hypothetical protein